MSQSILSKNKNAKVNPIWGFIFISVLVHLLLLGLLAKQTFNPPTESLIDLPEITVSITPLKAQILQLSSVEMSTQEVV